MIPSILISDTHVANRRMLYFAMNLKGCEILECADADGIVEILARRQVDLLLVSLYPNESGGYEVLEKLEISPFAKQLPAIIIGDEVLRAECDPGLWRGRAWLDRPFRVSELMNAVDHHLVQARAASDGKSLP